MEVKREVVSSEKTSYDFMPGFSDIKAMAKGTFMEKAKAEKNGSWRKYKAYSGGAYMECIIYYNIDEGKWKISLVYGDFYLGAERSYKRTYNGWISICTDYCHLPVQHDCRVGTYRTKQSGEK